jgi:hypothetical protein
MDNKDQIIENSRRSVAVLIGVAFGLRSFATGLIRHAQSGGTLDDSALAELRRRCLVKTKNTDVIGMGIEHEADLLRKVVEELEKLIDHAITQARQS